MYQPKTGEKCGCKRGVMRDNCSRCEGTGWVIDFRAIKSRRQVITGPDRDSPLGENPPGAVMRLKS